MYNEKLSKPQNLERSGGIEMSILHETHPLGFSENLGVCLHSIFQSAYLIETPYLLGFSYHAKAVGVQWKEHGI